MVTNYISSNVNWFILLQIIGLYYSKLLGITVTNSLHISEWYILKHDGTVRSNTMYFTIVLLQYTIEVSIIWNNLKSWVVTDTWDMTVGIPS